jgi:hypothetical protein
MKFYRDLFYNFVDKTYGKVPQHYAFILLIFAKKATMQPESITTLRNLDFFIFLIQESIF